MIRLPWAVCGGPSARIGRSVPYEESAPRAGYRSGREFLELSRARVQPHARYELPEIVVHRKLHEERMGADRTERAHR